MRLSSSGLLILLVGAACDQERVAPVDDPPARARPTLHPAAGTRRVLLRSIDDQARTPTPDVDFLSHDTSGRLLDRAEADADGTAEITVVDGGTVSLARTTRTTVQSGDDVAFEPAFRLVTFTVDPENDAITFASRGFDPPPASDSPPELHLHLPDLLPAQGGAYLAWTDCSWNEVQESSPLDPEKIIRLGGCPGRDTFDVFAEALAEVEPGRYQVVAWDYALDVPRPATGTVDVALSLARTERATITPHPLALGPGEELLVTTVTARHAGLSAFFQESPSLAEPWKELAYPPGIPTAYGWSQDLHGPPCANEPRLRFEASLDVRALELGSSVWDPLRLAPIHLDADGRYTIEPRGDRGQAVVYYEGWEPLHSWELYAPLAPSGVRPRLALPDDLAAFAPPPGGAPVVRHLDLVDASDYAELVRRWASETRGQLQTYTVADCE